MWTDARIWWVLGALFYLIVVVPLFILVSLNIGFKMGRKTTIRFESEIKDKEKPFKQGETAIIAKDPYEDAMPRAVGAVYPTIKGEVEGKRK